jgi:hypothetical protein
MSTERGSRVMTKYSIVCGIMNGAFDRFYPCSLINDYREVSVELVSIGLWGLYTTPLRMSGNPIFLFTQQAPAHWASLTKPQTTRGTFQTHLFKPFIPWT